MTYIGLTYNQLTNNLISQAASMSRHGVPNDFLSNLDPLALIIVIPICDRFFYPFLRRKGINFSPIRRITAGFLVGSMAMIWAAVLQHYIYKVCATGLSIDALRRSLPTCFRRAPAAIRRPLVRMVIKSHRSTFGRSLVPTF